MQKLFKKNPSRAVAQILDGTVNSSETPSLETVQETYRTVFGDTSAVDEHPFTTKPTANNSLLLSGISRVEITQALKGMRSKSAVGPDKISVVQLERY